MAGIGLLPLHMPSLMDFTLRDGLRVFQCEHPYVARDDFSVFIETTFDRDSEIVWPGFPCLDFAGDPAL